MTAAILHVPELDDYGYIVSTMLPKSAKRRVNWAFRELQCRGFTVGRVHTADNIVHFTVFDDGVEVMRQTLDTSEGA